MMTDISGVTKVIVGGTDPVDLFGYESCMFYVTGATDASAIKMTHGDDKAALEDVDLVIAPHTFVVHPDPAGNLNVGYIGARRYVQVTGGTVAAVVLQRPAAAPIEYMEPEAADAAAANISPAKATTRKVPAGTME